MTSAGGPGAFFRRNWRLKLSAFTLAVLLWATVRIGAVSRQDIPEVEVRIENSDPGWVVQGEPSPAVVQVGLTGPARDLFRVAVDRPVVVVGSDPTADSLDCNGAAVSSCPQA